MRRLRASTPDLVLLAGMAYALYMYYGIVVNLLLFQARGAYEVYDAATYSPARFFLPAKLNVSLLNEAEAIMINDTVRPPRTCLH